MNFNPGSTCTSSCFTRGRSAVSSSQKLITFLGGERLGAAAVRWYGLGAHEWACRGAHIWVCGRTNGLAFVCLRLRSSKGGSCAANGRGHVLSSSYVASLPRNCYCQSLRQLLNSLFVCSINQSINATCSKHAAIAASWDDIYNVKQGSTSR